MEAATVRESGSGHRFGLATRLPKAWEGRLPIVLWTVWPDTKAVTSTAAGQKLGAYWNNCGVNSIR